MKTYSWYTDLCYRRKWAGAKDGGRSLDRARTAEEVALESDPHWAAFGPQGPYQLRDALEMRGLSPGTVNRHLAAYFSVWRTACQQEPSLTVPPGGVYLPEKAGRTRVVTETELGGLCGELPPAYGPLAVFLWETGCRVGEALAVALEPVKLWDRGNRHTGEDLVPTNRDTVVFKDTKNGDDRAVPLSARAKLVLDRTPGDPLRPFAHLSQSAFNHAWSTARERMGLEHDVELVPHALRHSAITRWVVAGIPLPVVAKMAGHKSLKTTMRYTHVSTTDCLTAMEKAGIL